MMRHVLGLVRPTLACLAVTLAVGGCAPSLKQARTADELRDFDLAVAEYTRVLKADPDNREARLGLERARLRAAEAHLARGRRLAAQGRSADAVMELQLAVELNPTSADAQRELRAARAAQRRELAAEAAAQTPLESLLNRAAELRPAGYDLPATKLPAQVATSRQATSRDLYLMVGALVNISVTFDSQFRETPAQVSLLGDLTLKDALDAIAKSTATFYQVTGPTAIVVVNDTPAKRREYLEEFTTTLYLRNADLKETSDALRVAGDIRTLSPITGLNAITMRDTSERLALANKLVSSFDKARPELVVDIEVLEVDRSRLQEYGLQLATPGSAGISGVADANREGQTLESIRSLTAADVMISAIPALYYRLIKTDSNTRMLANPHLRMTDGTPATAEFGDEIAIQNTVIAPPAQGGVNTVPITSYVYRNIGVNIGMTPRTHANDEVSLALTVQLTTFTGAMVSGLPSFGNRKIATTIRLRDGETNILAGLIREDERVNREHIPGLGDIPVLGRLFGRTRKEAQQTDVVIMLTPHILRGLQVTEDDLRPVRVPREGSGAVLIEAPPTVPAPPIIRDGGDAAPLPVSLPMSPGAPSGLPATPVPAPPVIIR
jgi:type II secretory pathway component GspD/PulD (secretin)